MTLKSDDRQNIISYRLEKARQTLNEVKAVSALGYWTLAANRLYYAAYYASMSLLINSGIEASTHNGVVRMIGSEFVRSGKLTVEDSKLLSRLFTMRQSGDYEDLFDWSEKDIIPLIPQVEEYIQRVTQLITF